MSEGARSLPEIAYVSRDAADACYEQAVRAWAGDRAACDGLITQAQSPGLERGLLATAYGNRGLIVAQRALLANDSDSLKLALEDLQSAAQLAPGRVEPLLNQAGILLALNRVPEALELYDRVLSDTGTSDAHRAVALFNRAIAQRALGDMAAAAADLRAAREAMARNSRGPTSLRVRSG